MSAPSEAVRRRAGNRCEYCHLPQGAFRRGFHIEHIVARQHCGPTSLDNLAFACWSCNLKKVPTCRESTQQPAMSRPSFIRARTNGRNIFLHMSAPLSRSVSKSAA